MKFFYFFLFVSLSVFSQQKDVFFILNENHSEYVIKNNLEKDISVFRLVGRKELEELKENPRESYGLEYRVIKKRSVSLGFKELNNLNLVDYNWILKESWKPINRNVYKVKFRNLYFLQKSENNNYFIYKVSITISVN